MKASTVQLATAAIVGSLATVGVQQAIAPRASSSESHAVWNYINEQNVSQEMSGRFKAVNGDWPPKQTEMAQVLLEARMAAVSKSNQPAR